MLVSVKENRTQGGGRNDADSILDVLDARKPGSASATVELIEADLTEASPKPPSANPPEWVPGSGYIHMMRICIACIACVLLLISTV